MGEKLPGNFEVKHLLGGTYKLSGAIELHRLALEDPAQLERRKEEITTAILNSTCSITRDHRRDDGYVYKEVR